MNVPYKDQIHDFDIKCEMSACNFEDQPNNHLSS